MMKTGKAGKTGRAGKTQEGQRVAVAKGRFLPVSPRKVRAVVRLIKGMEVPNAQSVLEHLPRGACGPIAKVLGSAVANATRDGSWSKEQLVISRVLTDEGPGLRRFRAAPMGKAGMFRKKMCHLTIELDAKKEGTHGA